MLTHRPTECPECGHDRLRRRDPEETLFTSPSDGSVEEWICGLCRYEWSVQVRKVRSIFAI